MAISKLGGGNQGARRKTRWPQETKLPRVRNKALESNFDT